MTADVELLPCPWCGENLSSVRVSEGSTFRWRKVEGCCADGPEVRHDTMADDQAAAEAESRTKAIAAWNDRPKDAENEALRAEASTAHEVVLYHIAEHAKTRARAERLADALRDVMPFVVTDVLEHCDGNKCREQWCAGCSGDDEAAEAVARSAKAAGVAYALLHPTAAQENDDA